MPLTTHETYISVDVEAAGPFPSRYSLLSIGACLVDQPEHTFYIELQPVNDEADARALKVGGFSLAGLMETGVPARTALAQFEDWVTACTPADSRPVFVAFNAAFDWMFINDYFHRFLGHNPFGHNALDIKAFYMGLTGAKWSQTTIGHVAAYLNQPCSLTHNALADAQVQGQLFKALLDAARQRDETKQSETD
jgi:DNA polymerase III alpha subunit (gram-positive type)